MCRIYPCFPRKGHRLRCTRRSPQFWSTISVNLGSLSRYRSASAQVREVIHDAGALNSKPALSAVPTPSVGTSFACVAHEDRPCCPNVVNCLQSRECLLPLLDICFNRVGSVGIGRGCRITVSRTSSSSSNASEAAGDACRPGEANQ